MATADNDVNGSEPSNPLTGVTVCCTSLPVYERETVALAVQQLGGEHIYDLTPEVTHLLVGKYDTPKYRHVARARPDIKAMDPAWINAVRDAWRADEFDFAALEKQYQLLPLETNGVSTIKGDDASAVVKRGQLLVCLTGFDDPHERARIRQLIEKNGGIYSGELTKAATHLIVSKPTGRKYEAAINWGLYTVSVSWLAQSVERGMILDEKCFNPLLPLEQQGSGAYVPRVNTKRKRPATELQGAETKLRKLRKTASMKLGSEHASVWNSILGGMKPTNAAESTPKPVDSFADGPEFRPPPAVSPPTNLPPAILEPTPLSHDMSIFAGCNFYIYGFESKKLGVARQTVSSRGATICNSADEVEALPCSKKRFILVPQDSPWDKIKHLDGSSMVAVHIVTEFFIEKCLFRKALLDPTENVIGQPFKAFPIAEFGSLKINMSGFSGTDLHHISKTVDQLGGKVCEFFNAKSSILILRSLQGARKEKLESAILNNIPIVSADWLWACVSSGTKAPLNDFKFTELEQRAGLLQPRKSQDPLRKSRSETMPTSGNTRAKTILKSGDQDIAGTSGSRPNSRALPSRSFDNSAFTHSDNPQPTSLSKRTRSESTRHLSHIADGFAPCKSGVLFDVSVNALNKTAEKSTPAGSKKAAPPSASIQESPPRQVSKLAKEPSKASVSFLQAALDNESDDEEQQMGAPVDIAPTREQSAESAAKDGAGAGAPQAQDKPSPQSGVLPETDIPTPAAQNPLSAQPTVASVPASDTKAKERKALSAQLLNILDSHIATSNGSASASPHESSNDAAKKRNRRVFGRNLSTTSAASTISSNSHQEAEAEKDNDVPGASSRHSDTGRPPPATQVEYRDPEAVKVRAALLDKMSGRTTSESLRGRRSAK
ncbi:protein kinase activating protein dpb11 [Ceratocystis pirilliformis]|uniref:Protein kinase activating protein dpb11 n=1 Tax=Ceratocystis pirilliformis TaxID=259994 RepID=A0ABR3YX50_9PEZI